MASVNMKDNKEIKTKENKVKEVTKKEAKKVSSKPKVKVESKINAKDNVVSTKVEKNYFVRGNIFEGIVTSAKAPKTVKVERILTKFVKKYERYKKSKSVIYAHNPESINAKEGDFVRVGETRPISKTKNFIVMDILKRAE